MILVLHIAVAIISMAWAGYSFFSPGKTKMNVSYGLMAATLTTGVYLVVTMPAHILHACLVGVGYLAITAVVTLLAKRKYKLLAQ